MQTVAVTKADAEPWIETLGRIALGTQGFLYLVVGVLAEQVAQGDHGTDASQRGAIDAVARQPFGRFLLVVLAAGLATHVLWRLALAARGEPGDDEDSGSVAKRLANVGRAAIYGGFTAAAVRVLLASGHDTKQSNGEQRSTATVLGWPGGRWLVVGAGLVVIGVGLWNGRKAATRSFLERLDLHDRSEAQRRAVAVTGTVGYGARAVVFALVGWFLVQAGLAHDADRTRGLDGALHEVATSAHGTLLLGVLAAGLFLFGAYRILDGLLRRSSEITWS